MESGPTRWLAAGLLVALVSFVYAPAVRGSFIYDDQRLVEQEIVPESLGDFARAFRERHWFNLPYYRPVVRTTTLIQRALHGDDPAPYHLFNVLLMGATALLVFGLLKLPVFGVPAPLAWLASLLFALHPIASSTVYPISSGRETLLPAFFFIAAVSAFLRAGPRWYAAALALATLALFSQERAAVLPAVFVWADLLSVSADAPGWSARRWLKRHLPVLVVALGYLAIRVQLFAGEGQFRLAVLYEPLLPLLSLAYAAQTTVAPARELAYEARPEVWASVWRTALWIATFAAAGWVTLRHWRRLGALVAFWLGWAALALLPTANVIAQEAHFAERYLLLTMLCGVAIAACLAALVWPRPAARRAVVCVSVVLVLAAGVVSRGRAQYFVDNQVFIAHWLRSDPGSVQAQFTQADWFAREGRLDEAVRHYQRALELSPNRGEIHQNLALALRRQGRKAEAARHQRRAVELDPRLAGSAR